MTQYFPKPYEPFGGDINVKVDLCNYATKTDIKNITHVDTSSFASKTNLANLKTEVTMVLKSQVPEKFFFISGGVFFISCETFVISR